MHNALKTSAAILALALLGGAVLAQTPPPAPAHQGLFSRLFHPKPKPGVTSNHSVMPGHSMMPNHSMMGGQFIGNKNSHVFHMPGDKGSLPAPQNRVYFSSAAAAEAAGYHAAGSGRSTSGHNMTSHKTMMHGAPIQR